MAMRLMKIAIPELKNIHGEYLWTQTIRDAKSGESAGAPVWYDANNSDGRGIGDRSDYYHSKKFEKNCCIYYFIYSVKDDIKEWVGVGYEKEKRKRL